MADDYDYMYELQTVKVPRPHPSADWRCPGCGRPDTRTEFAVEIDISTASFQKMTTWWHPDCWHAEMMKLVPPLGVRERA